MDLVDSSGGSECPDFGELDAEPGVGDERSGYLLNTVDNGGMVTVTQQQAYLFESKLAVLPQKIHRHVAGLRDGLGAAFPGERR